MIQYHADMVQGSDEWKAARCGLLTASEMKLVVTLPKVETRIKKNGEPYKQREMTAAENDACRAHLYRLLAQRITQYVPPAYISDDMLRGEVDEVEAKILYAKHYAPVHDVGFITNDEWGFIIGYSPDGLIGDDGLIEVKSRADEHQVKTVVECVSEDIAPDEYMLQMQTGMLVSGRKWCDFISYSDGLPMATIRVFPDARMQDAIIAAATAFETRLAEKMAKYRAVLASKARLIPTERRVELEMHL